LLQACPAQIRLIFVFENKSLLAVSTFAGAAWAVCSVTTTDDEKACDAGGAAMLRAGAAGVMIVAPACSVPIRWVAALVAVLVMVETTAGLVGSGEGLETGAAATVTLAGVSAFALVVAGATVVVLPAGVTLAGAVTVGLAGDVEANVFVGAVDA
jgi:hypothetical protein